MITECQFCPALFRTVRALRAHAIFHEIDERAYDIALGQWYAHLARDHRDPAGAAEVLRAYTRAPAPTFDPTNMDAGQVLRLVFAGYRVDRADPPPPALGTFEYTRRVYYNLDPVTGRAKTYT